ncbi:hypothetical protein [Streptomyces anthocyanicus]|nr:hypothetical protein [Streptomyces anthocyanicus]
MTLDEGGLTTQWTKVGELLPAGVLVTVGLAVSVVVTAVGEY